MQISEKSQVIDDKLIIKKTHSADNTLKRLQMARDAGLGHTGENRHVGTIPGAMLAVWLKEAGVRWDDTKAMEEVINRKMQSGEFAAFRNWTGTY